MKSQARHVVVGVLLALLLMPLGAAADYKESYKEGMTALDNGDWAKVVEHMQAAIRENPKAGGAGIRMYGTRFEDYLPYYHLGKALNELGRYKEADEALKQALTQGAVGKSSKRASRDLVNLIAEVSPKAAAQSQTETTRGGTGTRGSGVRSESPRQSVPTGPTPAQQLAQAKTDAQRALDSANQARSSTAGLVSRAETLGVFDANPALRRRLDQADTQLERARQQLIGATTAGAAESAKATLVLLAGEYGQIRSDLDTQISSTEAANAAAAEQATETLATQTQDRLRALQGDLSEAERLLSQATEQGHPSLNSGRQRLARAISAARSADASTSIGALNSLQSELRSSSGNLRSALANVPAPEPEAVPTETGTPAVTGPPSGLRNAAAAFFSGDNDGTLRALSGAEFDDPRATLHAGLLRAAALYRKFLLGRQSDTGLLEEARGEAARCRTLDPSFEPDPRYFSPDFVSLYRDAVGP